MDVVDATKQKLMAETSPSPASESKNEYPSVSSLKEMAEGVLKEAGVIGEKQETVTPEPKPADGFPNKLSEEKKKLYKDFFNI